MAAGPRMQGQEKEEFITSPACGPGSVNGPAEA